MGFEKSFCPSPWLHMRIDNQGNFQPCRWRADDSYSIGNIKTADINRYFANGLAPLRRDLLSGETPSMCANCHHMEQHGKVSGRQRQLLKIGVSDDFIKTMLSSSWINEFQESAKSDGYTDQLPRDWQIDLGNFCNSTCIFCLPEYSSRVAQEYKKLGLISQSPPSTWIDNPDLVEKFCDYLILSDPAYIHFLGGETLIIPAFYKIMSKLLERGKTQIHIGFTTNLTVWPDPVIECLSQFQNLHVGLSIECLTDLNDYVRYPSRIADVRTILDRWVNLSKEKSWYVSLRPTPNCFTIQHIDTIYDYAYDKNISLETCNFLEKPRHLRINVLPPDLLSRARERLQTWLDLHHEHGNQKSIINVRHPELIRDQIYQDALSYLRYIDQESSELELAKDLAGFIKLIEGHRGNRILDYLPEYEKFLRSVGY